MSTLRAIFTKALITAVLETIYTSGVASLKTCMQINTGTLLISVKQAQYNPVFLFFFQHAFLSAHKLADLVFMQQCLLLGLLNYTQTDRLHSEIYRYNNQAKALHISDRPLILL